ncbi:MAG TPA: ATP-binding cassette domain-containing protein, partial [Burkholderiaceae bacterium]|nr:ATP-binding cassette domain-containing protein [Burkholderiaceae bacterium]
MNPILELSGVSRRFGGLAALSNVSLSIGRGEVIGLLGPNGAGKTTLVNVITGVHRATSGRVLLDGNDITGLKPFQTARLGLGRTFQVVQPFPEMTALENVAAAALFAGAAKGIAAAREQAMAHLEFTGLAKVAEQNAATLTLAMRKRLELAKG